MLMLAHRNGLCNAGHFDESSSGSFSTARRVTASASRRTFPHRGVTMAKSINESRVSVLLVDDHAVVREGYRRLLERHGGIAVIGEAADAARRRVHRTCWSKRSTRWWRGTDISARTSLSSWHCASSPAERLKGCPRANWKCCAGQGTNRVLDLDRHDSIPKLLE
jgi:hypothetical protein